MHDDIEFYLRPALAGDYEFAERTYLQTMLPLLGGFPTWDAATRSRALRDAFRPVEVRIIVVSGRVAGWVQVVEHADTLNLAQLHILEPYRRLGIGTRLIRALQRAACKAFARITLSSAYNNRAIDLYRRLGFELLDETAVPIVRMSWMPACVQQARAANVRDAIDKSDRPLLHP